MGARGTRSHLRSELLLRRLLVLLMILLAVRRWIWSPVLVSGESMTPTLHDGQLGGVNKLVYRFGEPHRGDIVVCWTGRDCIVKRIIGLPGEEIECKGGLFFVNGRVLSEPYVKIRGLSEVHSGKMAPGCFLIVGDNRAQSIVAVVFQRRIIGRYVRLQRGPEDRSVRTAFAIHH